jgi:hypothetical protein
MVAVVINGNETSDSAAGVLVSKMDSRGSRCEDLMWTEQA